MEFSFFTSFFFICSVVMEYIIWRYIDLWINEIRKNIYYESSTIDLRFPSGDNPHLQNTHIHTRARGHGLWIGQIVQDGFIEHKSWSLNEIQNNINNYNAVMHAQIAFRPFPFNRLNGINQRWINQISKHDFPMTDEGITPCTSTVSLLISFT